MSLILFLSLLGGLAKADYYTTASEMKNLLLLENELAETFLDYYNSRIKRLNELEDFLDSCKDTGDISHPVAAYSKIKRFTTKWREMDVFVHNRETKATVEDLIHKCDSIEEFDDNFELQGAVYAIMKSQETYKITISEFVHNFGGWAHTLAPEDIFDIGLNAQALNYFELSTLWLKEALDLYLQHKMQDKDKIATIYQYLSWCVYQCGDIESAIDYTQNHLDLVKDSRYSEWNLMHYKRELVASFTDSSIRKNPRKYEKPWIKRNDILCRHEEEVPAHTRKTLFCDYYAPHYQFYIKPMKRETASHNPELIIFHEIVQEYEMEHLKKLAKDRLDAAHVYSMIDGKRIRANYRISKNTWIDGTRDRIAGNIIRRVGYLVNLDMHYSEPIQVANYGVGGNYEPHYDFATPPHNASIFGKYGENGNRIATLLMYLTDVEEGGDTVFTTAGPGLMTTPRKGSAAFWYNLKRSGKGDYATKHAACPILLGEKWVANLWIHEYGQELRRPCSLNPSE